MNDVTYFKGVGDPLSNFYECDIFMGGRFFPSVENAYTFRKAIYHKRYDIADSIVKFRPAPRHAKGWTKDLQSEGWDSVKLAVMYELIQIKYRTCQPYRQKLHGAPGLIVEAVGGRSESNLFWSAGLEEAELRQTPMIMWPGQNRMGRLHVQLRQLVMSQAHGIGPPPGFAPLPVGIPPPAVLPVRPPPVLSPPVPAQYPPRTVSNSPRTVLNLPGQPSRHSPPRTVHVNPPQPAIPRLMDLEVTPPRTFIVPTAPVPATPPVRRAVRPFAFSASRTVPYAVPTASAASAQGSRLARGPAIVRPSAPSASVVPGAPSLYANVTSSAPVRRRSAVTCTATRPTGTAPSASSSSGSSSVTSARSSNTTSTVAPSASTSTAPTSTTSNRTTTTPSASNVTRVPAVCPRCGTTVFSLFTHLKLRHFSNKLNRLLNKDYLDAHFHLDLAIKNEVPVPTTDFSFLVSSYCFVSNLPFGKLDDYWKESQHLACIGIHPKSASEQYATLVFERRLNQIPKIVGIGEVGLDYSGSSFSKNDQFSILKYVVKRAVEMCLPLVLHVRGPKHGNPLEASLDCIKILNEAGLSPNYRIYKHCTTSKLEVDLWLRHFPKTVFGLTEKFVKESQTDPNSLHALLRTDPTFVSKILIESDAPVLNVLNPDSRFNSPKSVGEIVTEVARVTGLTKNNVWAYVTSAFDLLFRPETVFDI